jgi:hypothetical protein
MKSKRCICSNTAPYTCGICKATKTIGFCFTCGAKLNSWTSIAYYDVNTGNPIYKLNYICPNKSTSWTRFFKKPHHVTEHDALSWLSY